jgi:hypothetical protein
MNSNQNKPNYGTSTMMTPTTDLPLWIEVDLDQLGVRKPKPKNHFSSSKPTDHGPTPWKPEHEGQEPPF